MSEQNPYPVWFACPRKIRCNVNMSEVNKLYFYGGYLTVAGITLSSFLFLRESIFWLCHELFHPLRSKLTETLTTRRQRERRLKIEFTFF